MTREEAVKFLKTWYPIHPGKQEARDMAIEALLHPEIVHCKDCDNACIYDGNEVICAHIDSNENDKHDAEWFCGDGKRRKRKG